MKLLKMEGHRCAIYSMAMLLDLPPAEIEKALSHDGLRKLWPQFQPPYCYQGHHIQELIDLCLSRQIAMVPIEPFLRTGCAMRPGEWKPVWSKERCAHRLEERLQGRRALLVGSGHACAWDGNIVYDPNGRVYPLDSFQLQEAWLLFGITSN